jgi:hypothetical protein
MSSGYHHSSLEQVLRNRAAANDPAACVFLAQWEFDSRLLGRALQTIAISFPHFSEHDATHSLRIISYIGELLGPSRIARLSSATIWLIMSAAYYHDSGMIIPDEQGRTWWKDQEFQSMLADAAGDEKHALHDEAKLLASIDNVEKEFWPFDVRRAVTICIAEFGRQRHARRAVDVIQEPNHVRLDSPRSDLIIPSRIWRALGQVCEVHGRDFSQLMTLRKEANGIVADDKIHPRFAAAMLRLGDLLDLDNGRFCPTMSLTLGRMPPLSRAHERKHASIDHFLVRPDRIEVSASCKEEEREVYDVTNAWLRMLRQELADQGRHWNEIAPLPDFGAPPSAGPPLTVSLPKSLHSVEANLEEPALKLDSAEALKLFRDAGLYSDPTADFMRELLQNAFDATLLRLQEEGFDEKLVTANAPERLREVKQRLESRPVRVSIWSRPVSVGPRGNSIWTISVQDQGIGISEAEIEQLRKVGSSQKRRQSSSLPEWLSTSGDYGIGLQSAFYMTEKITLCSHDLRTRFACKIEMNKSGKFHVFKWEPTEKYIYGTTVIIEFERSNVPLKVQGERGHRTKDLLNHFDFVKDESMPYDILQILDAVETHSQGSVVPVEIVFDGDKQILPPYDPPLLYSSGVGIRQIRTAVVGGYVDRFWYRGLFLKKGRAGFHAPWMLWLGVEYDLYYGRSSQLLTLRRDEFRWDDNRLFEMAWRFAVAVAEHIQTQLLSADSQTVAVYALVAKLMVISANADANRDESPDIKTQELIIRAKDVASDIVRDVEKRYLEWMTMIPIGRGKDETPHISLHDVSRSAYIWRKEDPSVGLKWFISPRKPTDENDELYELYKNEPDALLPLFTSAHCEAWGTRRDQELWSLGQGSEDDAGIGDADMALVFERALNVHQDVGFRILFPLPPKYLSLAIEKGIRVWACACFYDIPLTGPKGVLPIQIRKERSYKGRGEVEVNIEVLAPNLLHYVQWVHTHRCDEALSLSEIAQNTMELIEESHAYFSQRANIEKVFDLSTARAELSLVNR